MGWREDCCDEGKKLPGIVVLWELASASRRRR